MKKFLNLTIFILLILTLTSCAKEENNIENEKDEKEKTKKEIKIPDENTSLEEIPDGYTLFVLNVNTETTYGNSIFPGNLISIAVKYKDQKDNNKSYIILNKVRVYEIKDMYGNNIFEDKNNTNPPSFMTIIVPDDDMILLTKASHLGITILPIPENKKLNKKEIASNKLELEEYIKDNDIIVTIPEN